MAIESRLHTWLEVFKWLEIEIFQASNPMFYFQSIKIILGPSDAWLMDPAYYFSDF
jgi:hypothetical protein